MKKLSLFLLAMACLSSTLYAQKDTVVVKGYYETGGTYGTLNDAIDAAISAGTINNTVFKLNSYELYVLSRSIYLDHGQNLEIVAPKPLRAGDADAETVQNSAPPQIVWTEEGITRSYIIQSYGDIVMKNIWVRYSDVLGGKVSSAITFENQSESEDPEIGDFDGCIFDYNGIGAESAGAFCIKADHYQGTYKNCFWRNNSDNHFRYYGRAVSFPYQSSGWHYDKVFFENCTFTNIGRIVMIEGNEYGTNVQLNHCTILNTVEWVLDTNGWNQNMSVTNSLIVNPDMFGYRAVDVCETDQDYNDFQDGLCDPPNSGLLQLAHADSFGFQVPFTDQDRKLFIGNTAYLYQDWMKAWYNECVWCKEQIRTRNKTALYNPAPMLAEDEIAFIDSTDGAGNKVYNKINVDWATMYDQEPDFIIPATNQESLKIFIEYKWSTAADIDWSYQPKAGFNQVWPLPENLAYNNAVYQTAAMGGLPLGDLNWYPNRLADWEAQREAEWLNINSWLDLGKPYVAGVKRVDNTKPIDYSLDQNYPNPFNPTTNIEFSVPVSGRVSLKVYNNLGQEVTTLYNDFQEAGRYVVTFDGGQLASGNYIYQLKSGDVTITKKFTLMK